MNRFVFCSGSALLLLCSALSSSTPAHASGLSTARFGGEHGNPMADNPTAIYYNPAGISLSNGLNIYADGNIAFRSVTWDHPTQGPNASADFAEPAGAEGANYGEASLFNIGAAPMVGATFATDLTDDLGLGLGAAFFVPFGGASSWDANEKFANSPTYPGAQDGVQRWYSIDGTFRLIYISAAAALSINDVVSIGVSGGVSINKLDSIRAFQANHSNDLNNPAGEGRAWIEGNSVAPQLGGGVMITPLADRDKLRIGVSYQAPPGLTELRFRGAFVKYNNTQRQGDDDEVDVIHHFPDTFRLGASYKVSNDFELRLFGDYQRWSLFENQCFTVTEDDPSTPHDETECIINGKGEAVTSEAGDPNANCAANGTCDLSKTVNIQRNWDDAFGVRAGASYWVRPSVEIFAGVGYDSNAIPDEALAPDILDFDDISVALGGKVQFVDEFAAALSYTHFFYVPRSLDPGTSAAPGYENLSKFPDASGNYKQTIGVVNVNITGTLDFSDDKPKTASR